MPFVLSTLTPTDIPAFALADEAANKDWAFARAQETGGVPRRKFVEDWTRKSWGKDPTEKWMKVSDEATGEFVAAALWKFPLEEGDVRAPAKDAGTAQEAGEEKEEEGIPGSSTNVALFAEMRRQFDVFVAEHIGDQPYACTLQPKPQDTDLKTPSSASPPDTANSPPDLQILMTDPKFQRQGAGSMLVKWGCDVADSRGLLAVLTTSAAGEKVYARQGFKVKEEADLVLDLRPFGVEATELRRRMIRLPRGGKGEDGE